jgi:ferredoxin--NADP+ reductase
MPNWCKSHVVAKQVWTPGLFTLTINADGVEPFEPGQFLHLAVQRGDQIINRAYSVASPHGPQIEFFIVEVDQGALTPNLNKLQIGDEIWVSQRAAGSFTLSKTPVANSLWLVGTGTGIAPYIAMLRDETIWSHYPHITLIHGTRFLAELGYQAELRSLADSLPARFVYLPAVTRETQNCVLNGRITQLLQTGELEERAERKITRENSSVMLCGNPDMLDEMEACLVQRGLCRHRSKAPGQIVVERYW